MANPQATETRKIAGLLSRRERWGLTRRGWLGLLGLLVVGAGVFVTGIYPFLAVTERVDAHVLIVEGWVHDYSIRAAVEEFRHGGYDRIYTTGGPVNGTGTYVNDFNTTASVAAERLVHAGIPASVVQMVPSHVTDRERTYSSALALREWLQKNGVVLTRVNLFTEDLHSRRSRYLFGRALGGDVTVGVIAVPNADYDSRYWWRYSEGVQEVVRECLAYAYARFFFHPDPPR